MEMLEAKYHCKDMLLRELNPTVIEDYYIYLTTSDEREKLNLMKTVLNSIEDGIFLISREISRRNHDWDTETRNENVKKVRKYV